MVLVNKEAFAKWFISETDQDSIMYAQRIFMDGWKGLSQFKTFKELSKEFVGIPSDVIAGIGNTEDEVIKTKDGMLTLECDFKILWVDND